MSEQFDQTKWLFDQMAEQRRRDMERAHTPVLPTGESTPRPPIPNPWDTSPTGRGPAGPLQSYAPMPLSVGGGLVILAIGAVLWLNTSVFLASALLIGAIAGAVVGTVLLWPIVRALSRGANITLGNIFQASFLSMCAYGATLYVLTHFGGPVLNPLDPYVQRWASASPLLAGLSVPARAVSFLLLTQVPCLLVGGATLSWRLKGVFSKVTGYFVACAVTLATLIILGGGAAVLFREVFEHARF
jgi:hypothetical protein